MNLIGQISRSLVVKSGAAEAVYAVRTGNFGWGSVCTRFFYAEAKVAILQITMFFAS